ncbi:hypothetical protein ACH4OY_24425 [Micromonospora rubida]|uniref:DUF732 domain-containing protein n=1 Tax=Micromonospora rubida TaxID=2697657 RepID=A0ABW7SQ24_9ACTN
MRMRMRMRIALVLAVLGVLAGPVAVLGVHALHPRDEDGYLAYLKQYGDPHSYDPVPVLPPAGDLIAEGDAACSWMREQPYALWRADSQYHFQAVFGRYLRHAADRPLSWGGAIPKQEQVTAAAWAYLCPADWELREPRRRPFAPPSD